MSDQKLRDVRERLGRGDIGREATVLLTVQLIELTRPHAKVEYVSEEELRIVYPDGESSEFYLRNLLAECEKFPEERPEIVERYVKVLSLQHSELPEDEVTPENVIAIIRDDVYRQYIAPELLDAVTLHLVGDLWIIYALNREDSMSVLSEGDLAKLGLSETYLHHLSTENIRRLLGEFEWERYGEGWTFSCDSSLYAASILLLNDELDKIEALVDGDLVVAVPARDTLLFAGANNKRAIEELRTQVRYVMETGHHLITDGLFRRVDGVWRTLA